MESNILDLKNVQYIFKRFRKEIDCISFLTNRFLRKINESESLTLRSLFVLMLIIYVNIAVHAKNHIAFTLKYDHKNACMYCVPISKCWLNVNIIYYISNSRIRYFNTLSSRKTINSIAH